MSLLVDYTKIAEIFKNAENNGRNMLFEHEVYDLLALSGSETPPKCIFIPKEVKPNAENLTALAGEKTVIKIVSPYILHKTEVGGVRIIPKTPEKIISTIRRMYSEVPEKFVDLIERSPEHAPLVYQGLCRQELKNAIKNHIRGVLQVQYMPPDSMAFGNELIVGLRRSAEFGMVISAGLGGTDTELYAERFRKGQAIVVAPTENIDAYSFFKLYKNTISYKKLAGLTRGQHRIVSDEQLIECFESMIEMGNYFSPLNKNSEYIIQELEINPFAFTDFLMVPLDGLCKFTRQDKKLIPRPIAQIDNLLHPKKLGIIGVSSTRQNFGRLILDNVLASGYPKENIVLIKSEQDKSGVQCVENVKDLCTCPLDLLIVAIDAKHVPALVDDIITYNVTKSVMLIAGGLGETEESKVIAQKMIEQIEIAHTKSSSPIFLGANCMGVISRHAPYDTWFIPKIKLSNLEKYQGLPPHPIALISQSGAFLLARFSQCPEMCPSYLISMGNQSDLTLGDMMKYFENANNVNIIGIYAEGFKELDGLEFTQSVQRAVQKGKDVIFYKAGRTPEGKDATSGHTASLAGDYMVCESSIRQVGGIVARTFTEFQDLVLLANSLSHKKVNGKRLAIISGAGFEAVGMADSIHSDEYSVKLGSFSQNTINAMQDIINEQKLNHLVTIHNPLDINPASNDEVHARIAQCALNDDNIDAVVLSLDPYAPSIHSINTENDKYNFRAKDGILARVKELVAQNNKPLITIVDGGEQFAELRLALQQASIPVFTLCDKAIATLSLYLEAKLN